MVENGREPKPGAMYRTFDTLSRKIFERESTALLSPHYGLTGVQSVATSPPEVCLIPVRFQRDYQKIDKPRFAGVSFNSLVFTAAMKGFGAATAPLRPTALRNVEAYKPVIL